MAPRNRKKPEAPAHELVTFQAALWEWEHGPTESLQALLAEPGLLPAFDVVLLGIRRLWEKSPPPSPGAAADRLEVEGAPEAAEELRRQAHLAHEWDKAARATMLEVCRAQRDRAAMARAKTRAEMFEILQRSLAGDAAASGLGLREVWNMVELPEVDPPEYALDGLLLRPALTIFGGEPGSRKTTLALALALGAIHAGKVLDREMRLEGPALLLENDTPEGVFYGLLRRLERGMGLHERRPAYPLRYLHGPGLDLADAASRDRFLAEVRRLRPAVTLIDSFSGAHGADEDKVLELEPVLQALIAARDATGGLVIAIDHVAKRLGERRREARTGRDVRGSGAKVARADAVWIFSEEGDRSRMECVKQRAGLKPRPVFFTPSDPAEGAPFALLEVGESEGSSSGGEPGEIQDRRALLVFAERILERVKDQPGKTKREYRAIVGGRGTRFADAWDVLTAQDLIAAEPATGRRGAREVWRPR